MFFYCFIRASVNKINIYLCVILFFTSEKYAILFLKLLNKNGMCCQPWYETGYISSSDFSIFLFSLFIKKKVSFNFVLMS